MLENTIADQLTALTEKHMAWHRKETKQHNDGVLLLATIEHNLFTILNEIDFYRVGTVEEVEKTNHCYLQFKVLLKIGEVLISVELNKSYKWETSTSEWVNNIGISWKMFSRNAFQPNWEGNVRTTEEFETLLAKLVAQQQYTKEVKKTLPILKAGF